MRKLSVVALFTLLALSVGASTAFGSHLSTTSTPCVSTTGNDTFLGTQFADTCFLGAGNAQLQGKEGNDTLSGEGDADTIIGGKGNDNLFGGTDEDFVRGGDGDGDDTDVNGSDGDDELLGNAGNDLVTESMTCSATVATTPSWVVQSPTRSMTPEVPVTPTPSTAWCG